MIAPFCYKLLQIYTFKELNFAFVNQCYNKAPNIVIDGQEAIPKTPRTRSRATSKILFMNTLAFLGVFLLSSMFGNFTEGMDENKIQEKIVNLTVSYTDGTILEKALTIDEYRAIDFSQLDTEYVFTCTIGFSNGDCETTASNCTAAAAGFCACAAVQGHETEKISVCN